jgi:TPR repeat protein
LQQSADAGFAPASFALGERYEMGTGVELDYATARTLYEAASVQGLGMATYKLGFLAHAGFGMDADYPAAMSFYQQAVAQGEPSGWNGIGQLYQYGQGNEVDYTRAAAAYQQGADAGEKMSQTALAYLFEQGLGVPQDFDKSFALLTLAANQNYGFGQAALALHYLFGQGTAVDAGKAYELTLAAVSKGVVYANGIMGYLHAEGLGTDRNLSSALFYFRDGAAGGDQYSASRVPVTEAELACQDAAGSPYEPGGYGHAPEFEAIDADAAIAACQAALAANPGSVGDGVWLARAYLKAGQTADALPYLEAGTAAGNALALTLTGDLLLRGVGVDADPTRALELYDQAAAKNFAPAQFALGQIYAAGEFVPRDTELAAGYFNSAYEWGLEAAAEELAKL